MRKIRIQFFNIVEVALALAIVGIGIAGIMSLFPVALNASRDSVGDNNAPDVAEQFLSFLEAKCVASTDWTSGTVNNIPNWNAVRPAEPSSWTDITGTNIKENTSNLNYYKVEQKTGTIIDFSAIVRVWKDTIKNFSIEGQTVASVPQKYAIAIYAEISWPAEKPYANREKRIYYLGIFNPNL